MKKARNLWRDLPQGGSRYRSVLTRLFLLLCLLATTQAGWAASYTISDLSYKAGWKNSNGGNIPTSSQYNLSANEYCTLTSNDGDNTFTIKVSTTAASSVSIKSGEIGISNGKTGTITVTAPSGYKMTSIVSTLNGTDNISFTTNPDNKTTTPVANKKATWTGSSNEVAMTISKSGGNLNVSKLEITYEADGGSDTTPPTLSSSTPLNNATGVATSGNITLTFSENVTIKDASKFSLIGGTLGTISASGSTVTIPYSGLSNGTQYTLSTAAGAVQDAANNENAALSNITFTTVAATTYTVTYNGNGSDGGSVPTDSNSPYASGATVTVLGNTGSLTKTGYTFDGWNTANDGSGTSYAAGATFNISANTTLYAKWTDNSGSSTTTFDFTNTDWDERGGSDGQKTETKNGVTFTITGSGQIRTNVGTSTKFSNNSSTAFTITAEEGKKITSVVFSQNNSSQRFIPDPACTLTKAGSSSPYTHTYTLNSTANSISFTTTGGNVDVYSITVNYESATTYAITYNTVDHGTLSGAATAAGGATVTVTATPESGYKTASIVVTKTTGGETVETSGSGNTRTFTMPAYPVTVTATFAEIVKQDVTLAWATSGDKTLTVGETYNNAATATAAEDGVLGSGVTYTSDNTSVATVSPTGVVTAVATGTAIITAKFAATDYYNAATDITYTVTVEAAVVASGKTWDFTTMSTADETAYNTATTIWTSNNGFYSNLFTAEKNTASGYSGTGITQIEGLKYIRTGSSLSTNNIQIYKPTASADGYLKTAGGSGRGIVIPASELETGVTVSVEFDGTNAAYGFNLSNAKASDSDADVSSILSAERTIKTFRVKNGSENVNLIANSTNVKLYKITIGSAVTVKAPTITLAEPATYSSSDNTKSTTFTTNETETGAATYYIVGESAETNAATVVSTGTQATSGSATDINLSSFASDESDVIVSAVTTFTKNGKAYYSPIVTATYTYDGVRSFLVDAADKTIQAGYRDNVDPYITYKDGTRFEIGEDDSHTLSDYFTFTYASSGDAGITVDNYGVITVPDNATAGDKATITITATPTPALGEPRFGSTSKTGTMTVTVKEKNTTLKMSFYWDPECTKEVTGPGDSSDWKYGTEANNEKERSVFNANIQNGRMIYVKPADGYEVWVATKTSATANDATVKTPTASRGTSSSDNFNTVHGIPLYISGGTGTLVIGLKSFISATGVEDGYTVSARFNIVNTNPDKRPAGPSFDPTQEAEPTPNTSQTIAAVGDDETSEVFSKFGSKTMSLGQFINYTAGTQYSKGTVATFSTEVGKRHIQAVQVVGREKEWYISDFVSTTADYNYKLAGKLLVSPTVYYANVKEAFDAPVLTKITTDQPEEPQASDYTTPTLTGYFFNKQKSEAGSAPYQGLTFGGDNNPKLSYSIEPHDGAEATINATTGAVTIGSKSGYAIVTVNYAGGESYKIKTNAVGEKTVETSPATITYRINILDPNEHVPTISPASKNFANSQEVKVTADDWDAYYTIDGTEPTANNGTLVKAGETATFTVGETAAIGTEITVTAIAYDPDAKTYGKLVDETYTKVTPLHLPVLAPYGTEASPYTFTSATQAITAYAQDAGADVYFTTDGKDPRDGKGLKYDGSSKIVITGTATVKAAAYKDGIYSDVVTGYYVHTDDLVAPWFLKGDTKITGTSETVTLSDVIKISNGREAQGSVYYYTLDGSNPTATTGQKYTAGFNIYKTTTAKVIAVENGLVSPITTVNFTVENESSQHNYWEANTTTTNKGKITNDDRKVSLAAHNASSRTATIYVENLTATFGGFDNKDWNHASIGEDKQGAALDGVGEFSVRNTDDADDENDEEFTPANFKIATVHGRTHKLPSKGAYVKFEPEYDGTITVWALQQGGLHYNNSGDFCNRFIRLRPVFIVDEQGNSIEATSVESTARLSDNWNKLDNTNWLPKNEGKQNGEMNLFYDGTQNTAIYNMYSNKLGEMTDEDNRIAPFEITEDVYDAVYGNDDYTGIHGYAMPSGGNVKYTFPVKAGKTYFFFGHRTKLCIRGFNFVPTTTDLGETVTLPQNADATTFISTTYKDQTKNVKLERTVKKGIWTTFCLPFSVSQTQLENTFGEGTQVMQFVNVKGYTMNVFKHYHHMIVAGTPILVKPTNDADIVNPVFYGVHIQNVTPEVICDEGGDNDYKFVGSYTPITVTNGSYYIGNKDGLWHKLNNKNGSTLNGSRAYLRLEGSNNARALTLNIASFNGEDDDTTTGIAAIESNGNDLDGVYDNANKFDDNIYNVQGQLVRKHAKNLNGLAKGVYIINGKKVVIND